MTKKKGMTDDALTLEALQVPENQRNFMNDQVFKFVFGKKQRTAIAIDFINAVLQNEFGSPVKDLEYEEQELSAEKHDGKESRLDVVCRLDNGALVDIEVQLLDQKNIAQRVLYYWAGEYRDVIPRGGGYRDLRPTIIICIVGFPCFEGGGRVFFVGHLQFEDVLAFDERSEFALFGNSQIFCVLKTA